MTGPSSLPVGTTPSDHDRDSHVIMMTSRGRHRRDHVTLKLIFLSPIHISEFPQHASSGSKSLSAKAPTTVVMEHVFAWRDMTRGASWVVGRELR